MADDMDYLEDIRFLFAADQDADLHVLEDFASIDIHAKIPKMAADMDDYLEDIRFLFEAEHEAMAADMDDYLEDIRFLFDTSSLEDDKTTAGDAKGAKWLKGVAQKLKKMKKGVQNFCTRLGKTVRRGFCCCVSVEE